jgi:hypothetical protein
LAAPSGWLTHLHEKWRHDTMSELLQAIGEGWSWLAPSHNC